jgi:wyosine [tRNA(Phe)-imidazoG37] synthetase (radical SAM superfamily)
VDGAWVLGADAEWGEVGAWVEAAEEKEVHDRMDTGGFKHVYGPVPSRRLGRSLGVDLVPFKTCTYDCIYCQLGRTTEKTTLIGEYSPIEDILTEFRKKLALGPKPDVVTLSGSGEPTLHCRIGELIHGIKRLTPIPVAVLTNGSLLWSRCVQDALMEADLVLPSLDAGDERLFRYVNRPHSHIRFETMVHGLREFSERFSKEVWLEVFLLAGVTGVPAAVEKIAALARLIRPARVQLNSVTRPPCEEFAYPLSRRELEAFAPLFDPPAEVIWEETRNGLQGRAGGAATDADILSVLDRRPCTALDIAEGLNLDATEAAKRLQQLCAHGAIVPVRRHDRVFYEVPGRIKEFHRAD